MPKFDMNKILNESPQKVLMREYENLKSDLNKVNAIKYKALYENASLSFILENSNYIFSEPIRGYEFYKNIMETAVIPFNSLEKEISKVSNYFTENSSKMSDNQKVMYESLLSVMNDRYNRMYNSVNLYEAMIDNKDSVTSIYDTLYEYKKNGNGLDDIKDFIESGDANLMDAINISLNTPELYSEMFSYLERSYIEGPDDPEGYSLNTYTHNVLERMMKDSYYSESVNKNPNVNLRHFILGLAGQEATNSIHDIFVEKSDNYKAHFSTAENAVNKIFEDDIYSEMYDDSNAEKRLKRLLCEKAVVDINLGFALLEQSYLDERNPDSITTKLAIESTTLTKIPRDIESQILMLSEFSENLDKEINNINEKYFSSDFTPSKIVSSSVGSHGKDPGSNKSTNKEKEEKPENFYQPSLNPTKKDSKNEDTDDENDVNDGEVKKALKEALKSFKHISISGDDESGLTVVLSIENLQADDIHKIKSSAKSIASKFKYEYEESKEDNHIYIDISPKDDSDEKDNKKREDAKKRKNDKYSQMEIDDSEIDSMSEASIGKIIVSAATGGLALSFDEIMDEIDDTYRKFGANLNSHLSNHVVDIYYSAIRKATTTEQLDELEKTVDKFKFKMLDDASHIKIHSLIEKKRKKLDNVSESTVVNEFALFKKKEKNNIPGEYYQDIDTDPKSKTKPVEPDKPQKRPLMQRIQNKALDANVKFKKTVAQGRRNAQDARNAGKAVAKIPTNVTDSFKKTISDWDEMDDNRRKQYIITPGYRKKYFKALKLAIMHGAAFAINPLLNIVLLICHRFSNAKDMRIRNELRRELETEIKVTEEKIEDAKYAQDKDQKYKLMRIKAKLDAELARVTANSKMI